MTKPDRGPRAFVLNTKVQAKVPKPKSAPEVIFEPEPDNTALMPVPQTVSRSSPRRFRWAAVLLSSLFALVTLWAGLAITQLVESFFIRSPWLGWMVLSIAVLAGVAALAIILREIYGLLRLSRIEGLQEKAARAINLDEQSAANETISELQAIYANRAGSRWGLAQLEQHKHDILDPRDRVRLAESLLITPLDAEAHRIIARRARRVTLLTTVTPAAALDILFVASQNLGMIRELATLYGGKPSTLATLKMARMVVTHLAVTGGLALSDNLIQHFVGKGLLGRLSARFGEGAVNGILTSRIGLAARDVCRPIPHGSTSRETLASLLREVLTFGESKTEVAKSKPEP